MENIFYFLLFVFWTLFWSFASVLIYRLKSGEKWIMFWRSHCKDCKKNLWAFELIPIFSWIKNFWKCKYCKSKISPIYPALEISTWIIFLWVWKFLINFENILNFDFLEIFKLFFWLSVGFITILYIFYDILFTEIHEGIMWVWIFLAIFWNIFFEINKLTFFEKNFSESEIFFSIWILIFSIIWFYIIMLKELDEIYDFWILALIIASLFFYKIFFPEVFFSENPILSWIIWAFCIFLFFYLQIFFSGWRALWWWDLRIWIMIWLLLGINFSFIWIFLAYIIGSLIWIFILIKKKKDRKSTEIPFWPFLWAWFFLTIFFSENLQNFIINYFWIM